MARLGGADTRTAGKKITLRSKKRSSKRSSKSSSKTTSSKSGSSRSKSGTITLSDPKTGEVKQSFRVGGGSSRKSSRSKTGTITLSDPNTGKIANEIRVGSGSNVVVEKRGRSQAFTGPDAILRSTAAFASGSRRQGQRQDSFIDLVNLGSTQKAASIIPAPILTQQSLSQINAFGRANLQSPATGFETTSRAFSFQPVASDISGGTQVSAILFDPLILEEPKKKSPSSFRGVDKSGFLTPATTKQKLASKPIIGDILNFQAAATRGFFGTKDPLGRDVRTLGGAELSGQFVGLGLSAFTLGQGTAIGQGLKTIVKLPSVIGAGKVLASSVLVGGGTDLFIKSQQSKATKASQRDPLFKELFASTSEATRGLADVVPLARATFKKKAFLKEFESQARALGLEGQQLKDFVSTAELRAKGSSVSQLAGLLAGGATSEILGRAQFSALATKGRDTLGKLAKTSTKKIDIFGFVSPGAKGPSLVSQIQAEAKRQTTSTLKPTAITLDKFKTGFKVIAPLGFGEGAGEATVSQLTEGRKINLKEIVGVGLFGAGTAGVLGGAIVAAPSRRVINPITGGVTTASRSRQVLSGFGNLLDLTEKPGDIIANIAQLPGIRGKKASASIPRSFDNTIIGQTSKALFTEAPIRSRVITPSLPGTFLTNVPKSSVPTKPATQFATPSLILPGLGSQPTSFFASQPLTQSPAFTLTDVPALSQTLVPALSQTLVPALTTTTTLVPALTTTTTLVPALTTNNTTTTVSTPILTLPQLNFGAKKGKQSKSAPGFIPQAKSKGKYRNLSPFPLSQGDARKRMGYVVRNTLSASGRIIPVDKPAKASTVRQSSVFMTNQFRKKGKVYIEKNKFRIDTRGEKQGLSIAKLLSQEKKQRKSRGFQGFKL